MATSLACVLLAATAGCGSASDEPSGAAPGTPASSSDATSSPAASPAATPAAGEGEEPYVPGDPDNEVRAATADELSTWPTCRRVWRRDARIPARYRGCVSGDRAVVADRIPCSFGGSMTTFDDRYYGVVGNVVTDAGESLATSRRYARAYGLCSG